MALDIAIAHDTDSAFVAEAVHLINRVYADAEKGLWKPDAQRTDAAEIAAVIGAGELAVARLDGALVGAVRVQRLASRRG